MATLAYLQRCTVVSEYVQQNLYTPFSTIEQQLQQEAEVKLRMPSSLQTGNAVGGFFVCRKTVCFQRTEKPVTLKVQHLTVNE